MAVLALLLVPPNVAAAGPATITLSAPFHGARAKLQPGENQTGCSSYRFLRPHVVRPIAGTAGFRNLATSPACATRTGNYAWSQEVLTEIVPLHAASGRHTIVAHWSVNATGSEHLTIGRCAGGNATGYWTCNQLATSGVNGYAYLEGTSNSSINSIGYSNNTWAGLEYERANESGCWGPFYGCGNVTMGKNATFSVRTTFAWWFNGTFVPGRTYFLVMILIAGVATYVTASGSSVIGGHASARLDLGTRGNGITLDSITIS